MNDIDDLGSHYAPSNAFAREARDAGRRELMKRFAPPTPAPTMLAADASQEVDKYDLSTLACTD